MRKKASPGICAFAIILLMLVLVAPAESTFGWPIWGTGLEGPDGLTVPVEAILSEEDPSEDDTDRVLDVVFTFGLMGNVSSDTSEQASTACESLLDVLLAYPEMKFSVGISGTLLTGLAWDDGRALQLLRDGVGKGVIEPLGTTYSEAILASMEPWDAQLAVSLGSEAVANFIGDKPVGFWNPSGVWKQEIVVPIAVGGYTHSMIEDTIVANSGLGMLPLNIPMRVSWSGREIVLFQVDTDFGQLVDNAIRSGSTRPVVDYLRRVYEADKQDSAVVVYAKELMVADDKTDWKKLAVLFQALADEEWIRVTTLGERVESGPSPGSVIQIAEGVPEGMKRELSEAGFSDWATFNSGSKDLQALRGLYSEIRARIHSVDAAIRKAEASGKETSAAHRLLEHSKKVFISAQYGFGRPGKGGAVSGGANWEMGRAAYVSALAAWQCVNPTVSAYQEDINRDGIEEVIMTTNTDMFVLSPIGAKLLYWHDLENGEVLVGGKTQHSSEEAFLNESVVGGGQQGALLDTLSGPGVLGIDLSAAEFDVQIGGGFPNASLLFKQGSTSIEKAVTARDRALSVAYSIRSRGRIDFTVSNNLCPDVHWASIGGKDTLVYYDPNGAAASSLRHGSSFGLMNVLSGTILRVSVDQESKESVPLSRVSSTLGRLGRRLDLEYRFTIAPGASADISLEFQRSKAWPSPSPIFWVQGLDNKIVAALPTYTRTCAVREFVGGYISDTPMTRVSLTSMRARAGEETASQVEAPMPRGRYDLVATLVTDRKALIENAGSYIRGTNKHEFFPEVSDSSVEIMPDYARIGGSFSIWVAICVGAAIAMAGVIVYLKRRKDSGV